MSKPLMIFNREKNQLEEEKILGLGFMKWAYENALGKIVTDSLLSQKWFSRMYGGIQDWKSSARKIETFVREYAIDLSEFESGPFENFNSFFIRRFKSGKRPFALDSEFPAFAEGRYFVFESVNETETFPVKGKNLTPSFLLENEQLAKEFEGGSALIARLCPVDYHRYHYPDDGTTLTSYTVNGVLHSVNPVALRAKPEVFIENERRVSILETVHFGKIAYVEVGAICVGKIVQSFDESNAFKRGDEKGYFLFGGSTVCALFQKGRLKFDSDLVENTKKGVETRVKLGARIAVRG